MMKGYIEWERISSKEDITTFFPRDQMVLRKISPLLNGGYSYRVYVNIAYLKKYHKEVCELNNI